MRTTIDLDKDLLRAVKERAATRHTTLSAVVQEALRGYLQESARSVNEPFELVEAGTPGGTFPSPTEFAALLEADELSSAHPDED